MYLLSAWLPLFLDNLNEPVSPFQIAYAWPSCSTMITFYRCFIANNPFFVVQIFRFFSAASRLVLCMVVHVCVSGRRWLVLLCQKPPARLGPGRQDLRIYNVRRANPEALSWETGEALAVRYTRLWLVWRMAINYTRNSNNYRNLSSPVDMHTHTGSKFHNLVTLTFDLSTSESLNAQRLLSIRFGVDSSSCFSCFPLLVRVLGLNWTISVNVLVNQW